MAYPSLLQQSYDQVIPNNPNPNPDPDPNPHPHPHPNPNPYRYPNPNPNPNPDVLRPDGVPGHVAAALRPAALADAVPRLRAGTSGVRHVLIEGGGGEGGGGGGGGGAGDATSAITTCAARATARRRRAWSMDAGCRPVWCLVSCPAFVWAGPMDTSRCGVCLVSCAAFHALSNR